MFKLDRWATGRGQYTSEFYNRMLPALQLISLWLTEDYPLLWYSHLTFGERRTNFAGQTYVVPTPHSSTPAALDIVKANLIEFGKTITFMFTPTTCGDEAGCWGVTWPSKERMPGFQQYRYPRVLSNKGMRHPVISVIPAFEVFFRQSWSCASAHEWYTGLFMFACVLGHEVAHGYNMFITAGRREPLWHASEKQTELGFSWEKNVLGHCLDAGDSTSVDGYFRHDMVACQVQEIPTLRERAEVFHRLKEGVKSEFTGRDAHGDLRQWPSISAFDFRGAKWSLPNNVQGFAASIHIVPTHWMVSWFQSDVWARLKSRWAQHELYVPLPLGQTFMIIYERGNKGTQVHRPLYLNNAVDAEILRSQTQYQTPWRGALQ
jgi:hypothetical protein